MRYLMLFFLVSTIGCSVTVERPPRPDARPFVSVTMAFWGMAPESSPVSPQEGCEDGCGCNGTGEERSGDGLAVISCRCPETCDCKASRSPEPPDDLAPKQETPAPVIKNVKEPPLVPVAPKQATSGRIECRNGTCYWVEPNGSRYRVIRR